MNQEILQLNKEIHDCSKCKSRASIPLPMFITENYKGILIVARNPGVYKPEHTDYSNETHRKKFEYSEFLQRYRQGLLNSNAGKFYNEIAKEAKLEFNNFAITNICKCAFPNNRDLTNEEINNCLPWLERQLEIIKPKAILVFGTLAQTKFREKFDGRFNILNLPHPTYLEVYNRALRGRAIYDAVTFIQNCLETKQMALGDFQ